MAIDVNLGFAGKVIQETVKIDDEAMRKTILTAVSTAFELYHSQGVSVIHREHEMIFHAVSPKPTQSAEIHGEIIPTPGWY